MEENSKLYTREEVRDLIIESVNELYDAVVKHGKVNPNLVSNRIDQWSEKWLALAESSVAVEVVRRHPQGIALSIWAGPPGSGKGTNIETLDIMGEAYAEVTSQGFESRFDYELHKDILIYSVDKSTIMTGTGGIFNRPSGEYLDLFAKLDGVTAEYVAQGGIPEGTIASPLIELMLLYRLVQGNHRVQIDLWPRLPDQLSHYVAMIRKIKDAGGKVVEEIVSIKILSNEDINKIRKSPEEISRDSVVIGKEISEYIESEEYKEALARGKRMLVPEERFLYEKKALDTKIVDMVNKFNNSPSQIVLREIQMIVKRITFRFGKVVEKGEGIRPDAYPLALLKRISVYAEKTSPAFLNAVELGVPVAFISTYYKPEKVIEEVFGQLFGPQKDKRWELFVELAGEVANKIVQKDRLIEGELIERVRGILAS